MRASVGRCHQSIREFVKSAAVGVLNAGVDRPDADTPGDALHPLDGEPRPPKVTASFRWPGPVLPYHSSLCQPVVPCAFVERPPRGRRRESRRLSSVPSLLSYDERLAQIISELFRKVTLEGR